MKTKEKKFRFWELHPDGGGVRGLVTKEPKMRKQDRRAKPAEMFAVVFFPQITQIGKATLQWPSAMDTISNSEEAAITKFMDRIRKGEKWETYYAAGHRVRKVRLSDLGDPV